MNSLSWMIYLAEVSGNLSALTEIIAVASIIVFLGWPIRNAWLRDFMDGNGVCKAPAKKLVGAAIIASTVSLLTPTSDTVYAIAASEMGEEVIKSPTATKAMKALDAWLDRQIAGEKE